MNGGETWSSWYNQPTAQFYHVSTDNAFPYRVCGGQQESGSACVAEPRRRRADHVPRLAPGGRGGIRLRRARPARSRHRLRRQGDALRPPHRRGAERRARSRLRGAATTASIRTQPVLFSPVDPHVALLRVEHAVEDDRRRAALDSRSAPTSRATTWDGAGRTSASTADTPAATPSQRGVVYTIAPSPLDADRIWAGTDDGLIHVTTRRRADTGPNVTPPELTPWAKVSLIDASHFDAHTAYAAINTLPARRPAPAHLPHARRRQDVDAHHRAAFPTARTVNVVREDPKRQGPALRRHRAGGLRVVRRRRSLAVAAAATCRRRRSATSSSRTTTSSSATHGAVVLDPRRHHAAPPGQRRRWWPPPPTSSSRRTRGACGGTRTPTRRCRPTSRPGRTRRTARSSTTG